MAKLQPLTNKPAKIPNTQLKYQRVEAEIRQLVLTLPLGAKLPAERDLAITYSCNFLTVRKALKGLVDDGIVVRRVGSGTFIARHQAVVKNDSAFSPTGNRLCILVYQNSNAYAYRLLQSIALAGREQKLDLHQIWVEDLGDATLAQVSLLKQQHTMAVVVPWFPLEMYNEIQGFVAKCPLPVCLPLLIPGLEKNCFYNVDIFAPSGSALMTEDACRYLHALGHQRIALLGPDSVNNVILQNKISGYIHYTSRENMLSLCGLVKPGAWAMDQLAERWKAYRGDLAIVCYDDEHALRFMTSMHKIGLNAPDDYCIIGCNDTEGSRYSDPPLTTIHQDFDYIAQWLLKNAVALADGHVCQSSQGPQLQMLVRNTCGGRDKITDAFCSQFQYLNLTVESDSQLKAPVEELSSVTEGSELQSSAPA